MVKGHNRDYSSSEDSDDEYSHKKKRKEKYRRRSRSPEEESYRSHHHKNRHRSRSISPDEHKYRVKIKPDPDGPTDYRHRGIKQEHDFDRHQSHRHDRHRDRETRPVRVKQEPRDDTDQQRQIRQRNDERRRENHQRRQQQGDDTESFGASGTDTAAGTDTAENDAAQPKEMPNFEVSGKLTEDTNTYKGVVIKYNEPPEARKPKKRWRLYPFKNDEALKPFHMHRQSAYLFGRERLVADIPVDHPSCSKQHAVFQYRLVPYEKEDGRRAHKIAPYIIDLDSANGTYINNKKMEPQRYYELFEKDVIKFGYSSRDYVLLHDKSDTTEVESE